MNNEMMKCGIINNCINETLSYYNKLIKHMKKIILNIKSMRKITDKQLSDLKKAYKEFGKYFFSKKTINCMKTFCEQKLTSYENMKKNIDIMKSIIIATKTKIRHIDKNKNYVKLMDVIFIILTHFCKNYKKFFVY
jgi:hypothetical protein